jgi:hypothetical protein
MKTGENTMRNILWISLTLAAISGCAGDAPLIPSSSTQGTTVVRTALVTRVDAPGTPGGPTRLWLRYEHGGTAVEEVTTDEVFQVGEKVTVSRNRGTLRIERLTGDAGS